MSEETECRAFGMRLEKCIFYFDLDNTTYLPKLTKYVTMSGANCSAFLDRNVTHLVTDKAATIAENHGRSKKWGFTILPLEEFATIMLKCLDSRAQKGNTCMTKPVTVRKTSRMAVDGGKTASISPTLHRYATVSKKRNLSQYLEEEKTTGSNMKPKIPGGIALYPSATISNKEAGGMVQPATVCDLGIEKGDGKKPYFRPFEHPFLLIDDITLLHAPFWKEYGTDALKTSKSGEAWPVLHWNCPFGYCPFVLPPNSTVTSNHTHTKATANVAKGITTRSKTTAASVQLSAVPTATAFGHHHSKPKQMTARKRASVMNINRARPGYCECCYERYSDLSKHISSLFHRQFALEDKNYAELDRLLSQLGREPLVKAASVSEIQQQQVLLRSPISQKSVSESKGLIGRNYTANKRAKQTEALKAFRPVKLAGDKILPGDGDKENCFALSSSSHVAIPDSPSCKRRRSTRVPIVPIRLEY